MYALLLTGGDAPPKTRLLPRLGDFALICAADSGLDLAREWNIRPDLIVGDMDSISDPSLIEQYPWAQKILAPRDKDESDTELGLVALKEAGAESIVLAGGGGGRLDHLLAIRALFERNLRPREWHTGREAVYLIQQGTELELDCQLGATVSIFPLGVGASQMKSEGLRWPLSGLSWGSGEFGLSNRAVARRIVVVAGQGDLLLALLID